MSIYAIGDVQGCMAELQALVARINFDIRSDELWFVGDLVNRGPASLDVLRFVRALGDRATVVLGNHDLHLLSLAAGFAKRRDDDTLDEVLRAPDASEVLDWLRRRPMMVARGGWLMVHAGLLPQWDARKAVSLAKEVETALRAPNHSDFLRHLYGSQPDRWRDELVGHDRLRVVVNAMTRMRFCSPNGRMEFHTKGETDQAPPGYVPWFEVPGRRSAGDRVVCGHWSALGFRRAPNIRVLDSGCVWGGALTALRLEDDVAFQVPCAAA